MKTITKLFLFLLVAALAYGVYYASQAFPILSGYGAKNICSCVFVGGRTPQSVIENELAASPLKFGTFNIDYTDSSATGSVFGFKKQKAIYRKGLGCTLVVEMSEAELRDQKINLPSPPQISQDTIPWPMGNLITNLVSDIDGLNMSKVIDMAFKEPSSSRRTRAILVIHDGQLIGERYAEGFTKDSKQIGWSMTKSITNALVGILVKQGKLDLSLAPSIANWKNDERKKITLNDLMHMSSGLEWLEDYSGPSGATNMLFKKQDMGSYAAEVPLKDKPGKTFYYSSGTTNIISYLTRKTIGDENYYRFPSQELFYKLGMYNTVIEPDAGGTFVGSSYSFATARDWARFGLLYLNDGVWNGERILPEGWVKYSSTPASGAMKGEYGAQFWLNAGEPGNPSKRTFPDVPTDLFWADGYEGQSVFILPSKKLVVVKLSQSSGNALDDNQFLANIIDALPAN